MGLVKKQAAEYKKVIGEEVEPEKLKELLWNAMDPGSKMIATQANICIEEITGRSGSTSMSGSE